MIDAVAKMEQPACHAGLDRMQRIAGRAELKLYQHCPHVNLDHVPDRGLRARRRSAQLARLRLRERDDPRARGAAAGVVDSRPGFDLGDLRPWPRRDAGGSAADASLVDHHRDGAAIWEQDMLDPVTRSRDDRLLIERDRL